MGKVTEVGGWGDVKEKQENEGWKGPGGGMTVSHTGSVLIDPKHGCGGVLPSNPFLPSSAFSHVLWLLQ